MPNRNDARPMGLMMFSSAGAAQGASVPDAERRSSRLLDHSKITSKGQITLPKTVRAALGVAEGGTVRFLVEGDRIVVERMSEPEPAEDPALAAFLDRLGGSIDRASDMPVELMRAMQALTSGMAVDPDDPIEGDVVI
jgi:antitoxin PrlF